MVVKKAVKMAQKMDETILGVVENMSYLYVPEIDERIELFGVIWNSKVTFVPRLTRCHEDLGHAFY